MDHRLQSARRACPKLALVFILAFAPAGARPALAIAGKGGKLEFAIDAPWRMEPSRDGAGKPTYGPIPIQISIHDAVFSAIDELILQYQPRSTHHIGRFVELTIHQVDSKPGRSDRTYPVAEFDLQDLHLIERTTGIWRHEGSDACLEEPVTQICEPRRDPLCAAVAQWIRGTSEWHAILHYQPQGAMEPGTSVRLRATVRVTREFAPLAFVSPNSREMHLEDVKDGLELEEDPGEVVLLVNELAVYLGDEPLPRFGEGWLYGDLHYHSQGTDNDAESGYNYRGVIEAMGAMGLDFVFAAEHASNSDLIVDGDATFPDGSAYTCGLRDMNPARFHAMMGTLHGSSGANRRVMDRPTGRLPQSFLSSGVVPQVFLGGEVDVIPELGMDELIPPPGGPVRTPQGLIMATGYQFWCGGGLLYQIDNLCDGDVSLLPGGVCAYSNVFEEYGDTWLLKDIQGVNDFYHARQHLIYLPGSQDDYYGFVSSDTERYGGGGRLLFREYRDRGGVVPEIQARRGYFFLAHPMDSMGNGSKGPDIVPYSEYQLRALLRSPAFLGLQLWNEDARVRSKAFDGPAPMSNRDDVLGTDGIIPRADGDDLKCWQAGTFALTSNDSGRWNPVWSESVQDRFEGKLHHGTYLWDRMLLWGLGADLWFTRGCEPRKVFMAGGSDAHGDFNFRRDGYFYGTDAISDTALGKPRNLVDVGDPDGEPIPRPPPVTDAGKARGVLGPPRPDLDYVPHSQAQVLAALREGSFCVTDGPALRIAFDVNSNGVIDDGDVPMGGVHYFSGTRLGILVEWKSTPEFGPVDEIHVYAGAGSSSSCAWEDRNCPEQGQVYAPSNPGPRNNGDVPGFPVPGPAPALVPMYRVNERLRISEASLGRPLGYSGTTSITVGNGDLRLANGQLADRYYFRAFARTDPDRCEVPGNSLDPACRARFAFTNPVWAVPAALATAAPPRFVRGDSNADGRLDVSDVVTTLSFLFLGGATLPCEKAADADDNGRLQITDPTRTLSHLFLAPEPPPAPFPACGPDPTPDERTCESFDRCGPPGGGPVPIAACLPDLVITRFEATGPLEPRVVGFKLPIRVIVENQGARPAGPSKITFSHGGPDLRLDPEHAEPGEGRTFLVDVTFAESFLAREIQLRATADGEADVEESDEDNNRSAAIAIDFPDVCEEPEVEDDLPHPVPPTRICHELPGKPDLVAQELRIAGLIPAPAGGFYRVPVEVALRNRGESPAKAFRVSFVLDSTPLLTTLDVPGIAAGETRTVSGTVNVPLVLARSGVRLSMHAVADPPSRESPGGQVEEESEANNASPAISVVFP